MPAEGDEMHKPNPSSGDLAGFAATLTERLRARAPRVHCITNAVAQNFTANVLLAAGCVPSMTISPEEIAQFVARADALLVNLGTFDAERREAVGIAVKTAALNKLPWVLDPVLVDRAPSRAEFARALMKDVPNVVRLNGAEFATIAGAPGGNTALAELSRRHGLVIALSGETDLVSDGTRAAAIANGHPLMAKVTAMGCAGSALIAACLGVEADAFRAAAAGLVLLGVAGEVAAHGTKGPGSFAAAIIDALAGLDGDVVIRRARVS
jgi:hydroxyethylthiazole kinase